MKVGNKKVNGLRLTYYCYIHNIEEEQWHSFTEEQEQIAKDCKAYYNDENSSFRIDIGHISGAAFIMIGDFIMRGILKT